MVGAKLELVVGREGIEHHGADVADVPTGRNADFLIQKLAIHVTMSPSNLLMEKCKVNLNSGKNAIIVTIADRVEFAEGLADLHEIYDWVEVFAAEQFLATNLHEFSKFTFEQRQVSIEQLVSTYNRIIDDSETDKSLKISVAN